MKDVNIDKHSFVSLINFIKKKQEQELAFMEVLDKLSPGSYCDCFLFNEYEELVVDLLARLFDSDSEPILDYLYNEGEIEWVGEAPFEFGKPETLYDYLIERRKHSDDYK